MNGFNGHKATLEERATNRPSTSSTVAHAALYLGSILEMIAWMLAREEVTKPEPPKWWAEAHPVPPMPPETNLSEL